VSGEGFDHGGDPCEVVGAKRRSEARCDSGFVSALIGQAPGDLAWREPLHGVHRDGRFGVLPGDAILSAGNGAACDGRGACRGAAR
jgi:hypothetical protein